MGFLFFMAVNVWPILCYFKENGIEQKKIIYTECSALQTLGKNCCFKEFCVQYPIGVPRNFVCGGFNKFS